MRKQLLATTVLLSVFSTAALAQDSGNPIFKESSDQELSATNGFYESNANQVLASSLIDETVYTRGGNGEDGAEEVGTITDVLLDQSGNARAVVIGVGGFLGIGEKEVAVDFEELRWSQSTDQSSNQSDEQSNEQADNQASDQVDNQDQDQTTTVTAAGERHLTISTDKQRLEDAPEFDRERFEESRQDSAMGTTDREERKADQQSDASSDESGMAEDSGSESGDQPTGDQAADEDSQMDEETQSQDQEPQEASPGNTIQDAGLTADELTGMTVYGQGDEAIGSVNDVLVGEDEKLKAFLINVGGFLGIGEKTIAVSTENVQVRERENEQALITNYTEEQLEDHTAFDEEAYRDGETDMILRSE